MNEQEFQDLIYDMYYPDTTKQEAARRRYAELNREVRVSHLKNVLQTDMDGLVWRAVSLLLHDHSTRHLPSILPLFDAKYSGVRYVLCAVFGDGGLSVALPQLERLAQSDPNGRVRYMAIAALGKCGSIDTLRILEQLLESDDDDGDGRKLSTVAQESIDEIKDRFGDG